jgi:hypothetical protein
MALGDYFGQMNQSVLGSAPENFVGPKKKLVPDGFPSMINSLKDKVSANEQQDFQNKFDYMKSMAGGDPMQKAMDQTAQQKSAQVIGYDKGVDAMRDRFFAKQMEQDQAKEKFLQNRPNFREQRKLADQPSVRRTGRIGAEGKLGETRSLYSPNRGKRLAIRARKAGFGNAAERLYYDWASGSDGDAPAVSNQAMRQKLFASQQEAAQMQQMNDEIMRRRMAKQYNELEDVKIPKLFQQSKLV